MIRTRMSVFLALGAVAALSVAGCSSSGGKQANQGTGVNSTPMTIAMVTHAQPGDTFWDLIRQGAQDAAAKDNVKLVYSADPQAQNQATLVQNAIDQKVDGLAVTMSTPDAIMPEVQKAHAAGIPVDGFNAGIDQWKQAGLLDYFGSDETIAGTQFGQRLNQIGAKHALCVIQQQGQVQLEDRCAGVKKGFTNGPVDTLYVNGQSMPDVQTSITSKLQQDPSIDQVVTLGAQEGLTAIQSVGQAGSHAKVATFDTNKQAVQAIKDGQLEWAVDQQPYLQGYEAVDSLWLYKHNGDIFGGNSQPVLTGPYFIDKSDIDSVSAFVAKGSR
jgi:ABC-type sugar transport system substrate-binding protein